MVDSDGSEEKLTVAACAARTGLTIRALRVYERSGLLEPPRAKSGWRQYGRAELTRLNTIGVLKSAGLTLAQIRAVLHLSDPPLRELLQGQLQNWARKKVQADRGQRTAPEALRQLQTQDRLDVDLLCELIRAAHAGGAIAEIGTFIKRVLALPANQRAALVSRHNAEINPRLAQDFQAAVRTRIDPALEKLMDGGMAPSSPKVQNLIAEYLELMCQYQVRETAIKWLTDAGSQDGSCADETVTPRESIARQVLPRLKRRPTQASDVISSQWTANPFLVGFFAEAERLSAQCRTLDRLLIEVHGAMEAGVGPHSRQAQRLVAKFHSICRKHGLGDPGIYARWAALVRPPPSKMAAADDRKIWEFLADSMAAT